MGTINNIQRAKNQTMQKSIDKNGPPLVKAPIRVTLLYRPMSESPNMGRSGWKKNFEKNPDRYLKQKKYLLLG